ncbi:MAG: putative 2OG-Fe(II) oxygenase [Synechococcus sp.]|nr:putative 2OG-Fe(II) oxygenase [Synechococcus sp.]
MAAGSDDSIELLSLFPRTLLKGRLETSLLQRLQGHCSELLLHPEASPDASAKLAGQLSQQRELSLDLPLTVELCQRVLLPACERWIRAVIDREPPQGRGPWQPGRYGLRLIDLWLNVQRQGDYNPTHTHGGSFSGVIFLQVPPQISAERFDGQLCFHGPEEWHIQSFRTGMAHYVLPVPGDFYVFPAWQPHSVCPFRGEGERWSLAFNVVAAPQPLRPPLPASPLPAAPPSPPSPPGPGAAANVSLSSSRPRPGGF